MSISFVQQRKELYGAEFLVIHNAVPIARLTMQGQMGSREGNWSGTVMGRSVTMTPGAKAEGSRPYTICVDGNTAGTVAQVEVKTGLFSRHAFHQLNLWDRSYRHYTVGLGTEGNVGLLYSDDVQLAQIDKGITVRDELYSFEIFALDSEAAFASILMCCYRYVRGCYHPGEKVIKSNATRVRITTDKFLKSKYDPNFKATHRTL